MAHKLFYGVSAPPQMGPHTRLCVTIDDRPFYVRVVHEAEHRYEVDMSLLGCNARMLWHEIYTTIIDAIRTTKNGIIVCTEFQEIHVELHDIFYSYMQENKATFHIYTTSCSFIKDSIYNACECVRIAARHDSTNHVIMCQRIISTMDNIFYGAAAAEVKLTKKKAAAATENLFLVLREALYDVLVYHVDVGETVWYILRHLMATADVDKQTQMMHETMVFFKYYNNYFRPIHHLERICFRLWNICERIP